MAEEYISGEKHREMRAQKQSSPSVVKPLILVVAGLVVAWLGFWGGISYQKSHQSSAAASVNTAGGQNGFVGGRFRNGPRPTVGQVTAVSGSSITITDSRSGANTTLGISSSTQITNNGQTVAASSIQSGDTVFITLSTTDKTQASRIVVNPSFGSSPGSSGSSTPTTTPQAVTN